MDSLARTAFGLKKDSIFLIGGGVNVNSFAGDIWKQYDHCPDELKSHLTRCADLMLANLSNSQLPLFAYLDGEILCLEYYKNKSALFFFVNILTGNSSYLMREVKLENIKDDDYFNIYSDINILVAAVGIFNNVR